MPKAAEHRLPAELQPVTPPTNRSARTPMCNGMRPPAGSHLLSRSNQHAGAGGERPGMRGEQVGRRFGRDADGRLLRSWRTAGAESCRDRHLLRSRRATSAIAVCRSQRPRRPSSCRSSIPVVREATTRRAVAPALPPSMSFDARRDFWIASAKGVSSDANRLGRPRLLTSATAAVASRCSRYLNRGAEGPRPARSNQVLGLISSHEGDPSC
jgi:hypothetical protein